MTIEQERDIAVAALERVVDNDAGDHSTWKVARDALAAIKRAQALQALIDQAQGLDMGYGAAQASPIAPTIKDRLMVAEDAITAFEDRYKRDANDPSCAESLRVWCEAWQAKSDSTCKEFLQVAEESPVAQDDLHEAAIKAVEKWVSEEHLSTKIMGAGGKPRERELNKVEKAARAAIADLSQARRASVAVPVAQPVGAFCPDCGKRNLGIHTCSPQYVAPPVAQDQDAARNKRIAHTIGKIFFYGKFEAETVNERLLESMLIDGGFRYKSEDELITADVPYMLAEVKS